MRSVLFLAAALLTACGAPNKAAGGACVQNACDTGLVCAFPATDNGLCTFECDPVGADSTFCSSKLGSGSSCAKFTGVDANGMEIGGYACSRPIRR